MFFFPRNLHTLTVLGIYQSGLSAGQNTFNRRPTKGWISKNKQDFSRVLQEILQKMLFLSVVISREGRGFSYSVPLGKKKSILQRLYFRLFNQLIKSKKKYN